jgi:uncharacterized protein YgiM (DUF1202 family)
MNKYVFLSFIFMGWAFFELSGGTDFVTPVDPGLTVASTPLPAPEPGEPVEIATTALISPTPSTVTAAATSEPDIAASTIPNTPEPASKPPQLVDLTETPPITLVSLEQSREEFGGRLDGFDPNAIRLSTTETTEPELNVELELPPVDLRTVSGIRVNMRNGPGTTYDVLARLTLGDEVEVLEDSGSGWLRLRLVSNRTVGWISASLISKPLR